jgi:hypothetical protein
LLSHELVRSTGQRRLVLCATSGSPLAHLGCDGIIDLAFGEVRAGEVGVMAPIEPQGVDVAQ